MAVRGPYRKKTDNPIKGRPPTAKDEVTSELMATGEATMSQLAQLFNTDAKTLPKRLKGCIPKGQRRGYQVYSIREAASFLVTPGYEIEEYIRQMSPQELPPLLSKEFWNGQNARINYEKNMGNLWPTEQVVEFLGELANVVRMSNLLLADDVNREESLTDGQRKAIQRISDAALATLKKNIAERFAHFHANRPAPGLPQLRLVEPLDDDEGDDDGNILAAEDDADQDFDI